MIEDEPEDAETYKVVVNDEGQYSIWRVDRPNAAGWHDVDQVGSRTECQQYIEKVWTDMTPRSVREAFRRQSDPS